MKQNPLVEVSISKEERTLYIEVSSCSEKVLDSIQVAVMEVIGKAMLISSDELAKPSISVESLEAITSYLKDRGWVKDYRIKSSIRIFKDAQTPLSEIREYLNYLQARGLIEVRGNILAGNCEARLIRRDMRWHP